MKVVIKNCDEFYNTFKFLETLNDQIKIICTDEEIWLQVPSSSHTALADVKFPAAYFESYECDRPVTIGVYCKVFLKILKNTYKKKGVTLMIEGQDGKDTIVVTITQESEEDGKYVSSYILKMVEIVSDMMNIPVQDVHSRFKLTKATLKKWKDLFTMMLQLPLPQGKMEYSLNVPTITETKSNYSMVSNLPIGRTIRKVSTMMETSLNVKNGTHSLLGATT